MPETFALGLPILLKYFGALPVIDGKSDVEVALDAYQVCAAAVVSLPSHTARSTRAFVFACVP